MKNNRYFIRWIDGTWYETTKEHYEEYEGEKIIKIIEE